MKAKAPNDLFFPAVIMIMILFFIIMYLSFGGKGNAGQAASEAQTEQCKALCGAIKDCAPGQLQAFAMAGCAEYACQKEADCTNVTCGGNTPEELKQALGC